MICFFFMEEIFDHVLGNEIDHVSPMFISEHESMQICRNMGHKMNVCIFINLCSRASRVSLEELIKKRDCSYSIKRALPA